MPAPQCYLPEMSTQPFICTNTPQQQPAFEGSQYQGLSESVHDPTELSESLFDPPLINRKSHRDGERKHQSRHQGSPLKTLLVKNILVLYVSRYKISELEGQPEYVLSVVSTTRRRKETPRMQETPRGKPSQLQPLYKYEQRHFERSYYDGAEDATESRGWGCGSPKPMPRKTFTRSRKSSIG